MDKVKARLVPRVFGDDDTEIIINDYNITSLVQYISIRAGVGDVPEIILDMAVMDCDIEVDGTVIINSIETPELIARQIYERLAERFNE